MPRRRPRNIRGTSWRPLKAIYRERETLFTWRRWGRGGGGQRRFAGEMSGPSVVVLLFVIIIIFSAFFKIIIIITSSRTGVIIIVFSFFLYLLSTLIQSFVVITFQSPLLCIHWNYIILKKTCYWHKSVAFSIKRFAKTLVLCNTRYKTSPQTFGYIVR